MIHIKLIGNACYTINVVIINNIAPCNCFSGTEFGSRMVKENGSVFTVKGKNIHSNTCQRIVRQGLP